VLRFLLQGILPGQAPGAVPSESLLRELLPDHLLHDQLLQQLQFVLPQGVLSGPAPRSPSPQ